MTNSPRNVLEHVASDRKNDMKASKTHGKNAAKRCKRALEILAAGVSITLPIEITLSPYQWFVMQSIATAKKHSLSRVFKDHFELNDRQLLEQSCGYVEP